MERVKREGDVVNKPLTPDECVQVALTRVDQLLEIGLCADCAILLTSVEYKIDEDKLWFFYWMRQYDND